MRWAFLLLCALASSCATGADDEADGVIKGRADTRTSESGSTEDDTATGDDTGTPSDDTAVQADSSTTDSPEADTSAADTGSSPVDMGPTSCGGEEPEPNDTPATARALGGIDDCDGSGKNIGGVLSSSSDVDVLTFDGTDTFGCSVNPVVKITGGVNVCMKPTCKSGTTELKGCTKGTKSGTECCSTSEIEIDFNCTGTTSDDAKMTMTVKAGASAVMCAAYSLAYHY